ncbi:MAG: aspartate kinase [Candidatus Hermodarchaeota archaeon]
MKDLIVLKFGGSCLKNKESFRQIAKIIKDYSNKSRVITVTSALNGITDKLLHFYDKACKEESDCSVIIEEIRNFHIKLIYAILDEEKAQFHESRAFLQKNIEELIQLGHVIRLIRPSLDIQDLISSYGEKLSTYILSKYLESVGINSFYISSDEIILTDDNFGRALPLLQETEKVVEEKLVPSLNSNENDIHCITGYYGSTSDKKIATLGRGGSDLSAAVIAYSLRTFFNCRIIYWKDVKGILNVDPQLSEKTSLLKHISYVEAKELSFFGSKVLHPLCLDVNEKGNIPSEIRSFEEPDSDDYTTLTREIKQDEKIVKAITSIYKLSMVTIIGDTMIPLSGTASKLFSLLGNNNINIVFISQSSSENNITFGIDYEDSKKVSFLLRNSELFGKQWFKIKIDNEISLVAVIGAGLLNTPGIAGKVFTSLGNDNINIKAIAQGSSDLNFTAIIDRTNCKKAINVLYDAFINQS